ncbi:MAG: hydroxymethylglutaryl-CoA lyase [Fimbriimonadaceae bacterium]|nr:hydroxymethylglutaryl-CoA lyase [Chthonomonadaceae bacterium]MCO5298264.1 hydroxymethylglutaryl-CoA lyase [Fimbriimonadaceae bacterium]
MIRILEVGPRDGLQNEATPIPTPVKRRFIERLAASGLQEIEATSFVSPKWVPQLADAADLWPQLPNGPRCSALVPNAKGLERALACGVRAIAVFTAASEAFTERNINTTIAGSLDAFRELVPKFRQAVPDGWVRGYVSTAFECPYAGRVEPGATVRVARALLDLGCDEVSLGDTIGVAVPAEVRVLTQAVSAEIGIDKIAYHFHDTRGTAVANVAEALESGVRAFDASAGGLGGCPYAPGAGGNLATEDLVYFLERSGIATGVDLQLLAQASLEVLDTLGRSPAAKAQQAALAAASPPR